MTYETVTLLVINTEVNDISDVDMCPSDGKVNPTKVNSIKVNLIKLDYHTKN